MAEFIVNPEQHLLNSLAHFFSDLKNRKYGQKDQELYKTLAAYSNLHILLADDDEDDRQFFSEAIASIAPDLKLTTVQNGDELLKKLKKNRLDLPDFIFLDLNMPYKNGLECLKEIKSLDFLNKVPVLIYSTSAHSDQVETTYLNGANLYVQKPSSFEGITRVLKTIFSFDPSRWFEQPVRDKFILK